MNKINKVMIDKYFWDRVEENKYYVWHFEAETQTLIAITDTAEKAQFLATAANRFSYEVNEQGERKENNRL